MIILDEDDLFTEEECAAILMRLNGDTDFMEKLRRKVRRLTV